MAKVLISDHKNKSAPENSDALFFLQIVFSYLIQITDDYFVGAGGRGSDMGAIVVNFWASITFCGLGWAT